MSKSRCSCLINPLSCAALHPTYRKRFVSQAASTLCNFKENCYHLFAESGKLADNCVKNVVLSILVRISYLVFFIQSSCIWVVTGMLPWAGGTFLSERQGLENGQPFCLIVVCINWVECCDEGCPFSFRQVLGRVEYWWVEWCDKGFP